MNKILIIDDELIIRERLSMLLKLEGYKTFEAESGRDGLELFIKENPDILLVDIKMPGMDGIEVLKKIKEMKSYAEVIMITGHGGIETVIEALKLGAFRYVEKPFEYDELKIEISKALEKQSIQKKLDRYIKDLEKAIKEKTRELNLRIKAEKALQENLEEAKEYQIRLNCINFPRLYNMSFYSCYVPFDKVGGDIFNIIRIGKKVFFYLSDIAGHGVPSAILSTFIKAQIDDLIKIKRIVSPKKLIKLLKALLKPEEIFRENLFTLFIGSFDMKSLKFSYINAGHIPPILISGSKINQLEVKNKPITDLIEFNDYKEERIKLKDDFKILIFSDGLIDWIDNNGSTGRTTDLKDFIDYVDYNKTALNDAVSRYVSNIIERKTDDISYLILDMNSNFEKKYFCSMNEYDEIIADFENEIYRRYGESKNLNRALQLFNEAVINGIEHGNLNDKNKIISIKVFYKEKYLIFVVKDEGHGFNWGKMDFNKMNSSLMERGRGLFLIKKFSQKIRFNKEGNEISVKVNLA